MFKSCSHASKSLIKFGFDASVKTDNTVSENSNIIGVGSISFLCQSFFISFFTRNSKLFLKTMLVFWKSIYNYFWLFWLYVSTLMNYGIITSNRGPFFNCRSDCFKYFFFPNFLSEWSQLAPEIQNSESIVVFKSKLLSFIRPSKRSIFTVNDPEGVKYLTRLRLHFSHLNEHKFRHGFLDTLNPLCNCSLEVEGNEYFFLRGLNFENARRSLSMDISSISSAFINFPSHLKVELLLFGDSKLPAIDNDLIFKGLY